jgi:hypothetical protein
MKSIIRSGIARPFCASASHLSDQGGDENSSP